MNAHNTPSLDDRIKAVADTDTDGFTELVKIGGLDPKKDFRYANWSEVDFTDQDIRGFDFTGARMHGCKFNGALIDGARFDLAEMEGSNLEVAADYSVYVHNWIPPEHASEDSSMPTGSEFQDAPFAPKLIMQWQYAQKPNGKEVAINAVSSEITKADWDAVAANLSKRGVKIPGRISALSYAKMLASATGKSYVAEQATREWNFYDSLPDTIPREGGLGFRVLRLHVHSKRTTFEKR